MRRLSRSAPLAFFVLAIALPAAARTQASSTHQTTPPRLSYTAVHDPQFVPAAQATWVGDEDRVIGLMSGATPKAYPASILAQHGLVEDKSPSGPIAVTW